MNSAKMIQEFKLVPPDGGYGYVIVLAVCIINVTSSSFVQSYGILFQSIYDELDMNTTNIVTQFCTSVIAFSFAGFATPPLMGVLSLRKLTFLGSAVTALGSVATVFADSQGLLMFSQILQSIGSGLIMTTSFTAINNYFLRKRWLFMTLSQVCPALSSMVAPIFLNWSLDYYGQRSTLLLIVGFMMQTFVASCLLQPVSWHMKRVPIDNVPEKELLLTKSVDLKTSLKINEEISNDVVTLKITIADSPGPTIDEKQKVQTVEKADAVKSSRLRNTLGKIFDLSIMKNFTIMNACLGIAVCMFAHSTYVLLLPMALEAEDKWDKKTVAWAIALLGFGDIATRIVMLLFSTYFAKIPSRVVYIVGIVIAVLSRLGQLWWVNRTVVMCFITIAGVSQCIILTLIPLILAELTDQKQFPAAIGNLMMMLGLINIVFGPVIGKIRDLSNSYLTVFYILTSFFAIVALFWCIEMCYDNNQRKIKERLKETPKRTTARRINKRR